MNRNVAIIGLGTVGEATVKSLRKYASLIEQRTSLKLSIAKICDIRPKIRSFANKYKIPFTTEFDEVINDPAIDIVVELIGGLSPAYEILSKSLRQGKNVVTANKALLAEHGKELFSLAYRHKKGIGFEASVCGAIPLIRSVADGLVCCEVSELYGILNGTTNYVLYKMQKERCSFSQALREAQAKGFAEQKPDFDIQGVDSVHKLSILSYLCFGIWPTLKKVFVEGIETISSFDIIYAQKMAYRIKLLAIAKRSKEGLDLRVHPTLIPEDHPLAQVSSSFNAVWLNTAPAGSLLFYGKGAGGSPTSSSIVSDIVNLSFASVRPLRRQGIINLRPIEQLRSKYYLRLMVKDEPGVLAKIANVLATTKISIASVVQQETGRKKFVPIVMITHDSLEANVRKAMTHIDRLAAVRGPSQIIRIEDL